MWFAPGMITQDWCRRSRPAAFAGRHPIGVSLSQPSLGKIPDLHPRGVISRCTRVSPLMGSGRPERTYGWPAPRLSDGFARRAPPRLRREPRTTTMTSSASVSCRCSTSPLCGRPPQPTPGTVRLGEQAAAASSRLPPPRGEVATWFREGSSPVGAVGFIRLATDERGEDRCRHRLRRVDVDNLVTHGAALCGGDMPSMRLTRWRQR
jgi:hypothetical protein